MKKLLQLLIEYEREVHDSNKEGRAFNERLVRQPPQRGVIRMDAYPLNQPTLSGFREFLEKKIK